MKNFKFKLLLLLSLLLVLFPINSLANEKEVSLYLDNKKIETDVNPFIEEGRTLVPIRVISESLGYEVSWDGENQVVTIKNNITTISMKINDPNVTVNEKSSVLDVAPTLKEDRTFVPIRFVSEKMGLKVDWDQESYSVLLSRNVGIPTLGFVTPEEPVGEEVPVVVKKNEHKSGNIIENIPQGTQYIGNKNSLKFHHSWCKSVGDMENANKTPIETRDEAINRGFVPCKRCNP